MTFNNLKALLAAASSFLMLAHAGRADVIANSLFSDNAVLQRDKRVPVWGKAVDGEKVEVKFAGQKVATVAKDGRWRVWLEPMPASTEGRTMTIRGNNTVSAKNLLVGEVWLCAGQSNMGMQLKHVSNGREEVASCADSMIRLLTVPQCHADTPKENIAVDWKLCSPATLPDFSAVAYFFGRDLRKALNVPIGLIHSSYGGTSARAWMDRQTLTTDPDFKALLDGQARSEAEFDPAKLEETNKKFKAKYDTAVSKALAEGKPKPRGPQVDVPPKEDKCRPACLYNPMIGPLQPYAIRGVAWYQGESDADAPVLYRKLFPALIQSWRKQWAQEKMPFLFVQIAPCRRMPPSIREAQLLAWKSTQETAMVVTSDVGDANDIHPKDKEPVGNRLALAARAMAYGEKLEYSGPEFESMSIRGNRAVIHFSHVGGGLVAKEGDLKGFFVAGDNGTFYPAKAEIKGDTVEVFSDQVSKPIAVRYGWANVPEINLFNKEGLPASPFRTDVSDSFAFPCSNVMAGAEQIRHTRPVALSPFNDVVSLAGPWRFALDPKRTGEDEKWFTHDLPDTVLLPGTVAQNKKGPRVQPSEITMQLSSEYPYEGVAWYQRTVVIPEDWKGHVIELYLERTKLTKVWLDDVSLGEQDSLGVAQNYRLGEITPGSHRLTIRVDSQTLPKGVHGHMENRATQTRWNGLLGDLYLAAHEPIWIEEAHIAPNVSDKLATVNLTVKNLTSISQTAQIILKATPYNVPEAKDRKPIVQNQGIKLIPGVSNVSISLTLSANALLWDEFHPALYRIAFSLQTEGVNGKRHNQTTVREFGLREFRSKGGQFTINGRVTMLRGKHDALVFPIEGYPPMNLEEWIRILTIAKSYGINHYRFHSCCPPEAAFKAADLVGIYLQPELFVMNRSGETVGEYLISEGKRMLTSYGNHPSFVMLSLGNELSGGRVHLANMVSMLRKHDPTRLYVEGSNNEFGRPTLAEGDDYWTTCRTPGNPTEHAVRGSFAHADKPLGHIQRLRPATTYDYRTAIKGVPIPVIGHEVGQFQTFPDFREIKEYTGVQKPWNLETFRRRLETAGMLDQASAFMAASGALALQCYREDIEAALRTPGFGGFQLLDLQDYPGQGTALVGILNAFMESKGLISPETWRHFCSEVVPLARMESYTWTNEQTVTAKIDVAQYGPSDLHHTPLNWTLVDERQRPVAEGELSARDYPNGLTSAGTVTVPLAKLPAPARYHLKLRLGNTEYQNDYPLWIYPSQVDTAPSSTVVIREEWNTNTQKLLLNGKNVLLIPSPEKLPGVEGMFTPDFWCYPMFRNICEIKKKTVSPGTLGLLIDKQHPALARFPTDTHSDWQWWDLIEGSRALILNSTPVSFRPIVQVIDNCDRNYKLGCLFEAKVAEGKLLVCTLDLLHKQNSPVARQMLFSLLQYAKSNSPCTATLDMKTVDAIFTPAKQVIKKNPDGSYTEFFERKD